jgi:hypothetical protein
LENHALRNNEMNLTTNQKLALSLSSISIGAFFAGLLIAGSFIMFFGAFILLFLYICAVIIVILGYLFRLLLNPTVNRFPISAFLHCFFIFVAVASFLYGGQVKTNWIDSKNEKFMGQTVSKLEVIRSRKKRYPNDLPTELSTNMPKDLIYKSDGKTYTFSYIPTLGFLDLKVFDSSTGEWNRQ